MNIFSYDEIIGNTNTLTIIKQSILHHTFPQVSFFCGKSGTGKSTTAAITGLALTCEQPINGAACLGCASCQANIQAITSTGRGAHFYKINTANKDTMDNMAELLKEIFLLQSSKSPTVYIFEEAHALSEANQLAILDEIDKIPDNVYLMFTTTEPTRMLPELRNRGITFNFSRLTKSEANILVEQICRKKHIGLSGSLKQMILNYAKGIPRGIVNVLDYITENTFTEETIIDFLGCISNESFILLLEACRSENMFTFINVLESLLDKHTSDVIIKQFKDFMLRVLFLVEANVKDSFTKDEILRIQNLIDSSNVLEICNLVDTLSIRMDETDLKYKLLKIRQVLLQKSMSHIITESRTNALIQSKQSQQRAKETQLAAQASATDTMLTPLNFELISQIGGSNES